MTIFVLALRVLLAAVLAPAFFVLPESADVSLAALLVIMELVLVVGAQPLLRWVLGGIVWLGESRRPILVRAGQRARMTVFRRVVSDSTRRRALVCGLCALLPVSLWVPWFWPFGYIVLLLCFKALPVALALWWIAGTAEWVSALGVLQLAGLRESVEIPARQPFDVSVAAASCDFVLCVPSDPTIPRRETAVQDSGGGFPKAAALFMMTPNGRTVLEAAGLVFSSVPSRGAPSNV